MAFNHNIITRMAFKIELLNFCFRKGNVDPLFVCMYFVCMYGIRYIMYGIRYNNKVQPEESLSYKYFLVVIFAQRLVGGLP